MMTMGLAISAVLYIICLSGTVSVFKDVISLFEQGDVPAVTALSGDALMIAAQLTFWGGLAISVCAQILRKKKRASVRIDRRLQRITCVFR